MSGAAPAWTRLRPWRNLNPGDLRTLGGTDKWGGQVEVDHAAGGPFAIFASRTDGWRALGVCLLAYRNFHGINTIRGLVNRWAPGSDNNDTDAYMATMARIMGVGVDAEIDLADESTMLKASHGIALQEGGTAIQWPIGEQASGIKLALAGLTVPAPVHAPSPAARLPGTPSAEAALSEADKLNDAELERVKGNGA